MVDTQQNPQIVGELPEDPTSIGTAQEALLSLLNSADEPVEKKKEEEEQPSTEDVEESDESEEEPEEAEEAEEEESPDADDESPEAEEETEDEEVEESTVYTVKVNGQDVEVSEDELIKGYSRQSDYTQKTQELAEYRRQMDQGAQHLQAEIAQTQQARAQYVDAVATAIESNYSHLQNFANVDWERLKTENREEYLTKRDEYRQAEDGINQLKQKHAEASQQQQQEEAQQHQRMLQEEHHKMVSILPQWAEPETQRALAKSVTEFAISKGYTQEELSQLIDHRSILVLMQAKAYEDLTRKQTEVRKKKVKNKPKVVRTKAKKDKSDNAQAVRAERMKRLAQTGRVDDAAGLFEDFVEL
jgi:hypothetical protein